MGILRDTYIVNNNTDTSRISYEMSRKNDIEESQKQKEVIDKAIKLIKYNERYRNEAEVYQFVDIISEILNPLQNILEQDETTNNAYLKEFEDWLKEVSE